MSLTPTIDGFLISHMGFGSSAFWGPLVNFSVLQSPEWHELSEVNTHFLYSLLLAYKERSKKKILRFSQAEKKSRAQKSLCMWNILWNSDRLEIAAIFVNSLETFSWIITLLTQLFPSVSRDSKICDLAKTFPTSSVLCVILVDPKFKVRPQNCHINK